MVAAPRASWTGARGGTGLTRVLPPSRSRPRSPSRSSAHARRRSPRRPAGRQCSRRGPRRPRRSASSRTIGRRSMRSARSAPDAIHHTPGPNRAVPRLTSVGTPDPRLSGPALMARRASRRRPRCTCCALKARIRRRSLPSSRRPRSAQALRRLKSREHIGSSRDRSPRRRSSARRRGQ
jgi:hypothetical protein